MRHHLYNPDFNFVRPPEDFNKYTDRELLQYCLGATMYMPGTKDFTPKILSGAMPGLTTVVLCFEDACPEESVEAAEQNVYRLLDTLAFATEEGTLSTDNIPLIFVRTRNPEQFRHFAAGLNKRRSKALCGINFPKFSVENGEEYFAYLKELNEKLEDVLYGMPIIESPEVAYKESRINEANGQASRFAELTATWYCRCVWAAQIFPRYSA